MPRSISRTADFEGQRAWNEASLENAYAAFASSLPVLCRTDVYAADAVLGRDGRHFERAGKLACAQSWRFARGEDVTIVLFTRVRWDDSLDLYPMHLDVFLFAEEEVAEGEEPHAVNAAMRRATRWGRCAGRPDSTSME